MEIQVCRFRCRFIKINVEELTEIQYKYVDAIEEYKFRYKKVPTIRTICKLVDVKSPATAFTMLETLKAKGYDYEVL